MKRSRARRRREILFWLISALVVLSMICSLVLMISPSRFEPPLKPAQIFDVLNYRINAVQVKAWYRRHGRP